MAAAVEQAPPAETLPSGIEHEAAAKEDTSQPLQRRGDARPHALLDDFLTNFNRALADRSVSSVVRLFGPDGFWRDHLASFWGLRTLYGHKQLEQFLTQHFAIRNITEARGNAFREPKFGYLDGISGAEGITGMVDFTSDLGRGRGVIRLAQHGENWKIFSLFLSLEEMAGCEEPLGRRRPRPSETPSADSRNWAEKRAEEFAFKDSDPSVLIIGMSCRGKAGRRTCHIAVCHYRSNSF